MRGTAPHPIKESTMTSTFTEADARKLHPEWFKDNTDRGPLPVIPPAECYDIDGNEIPVGAPSGDGFLDSLNRLENQSNCYTTAEGVHHIREDVERARRDSLARELVAKDAWIAALEANDWDGMKAGDALREAQA
jgi:hypothetical protein